MEIALWKLQLSIIISLDNITYKCISVGMYLFNITIYTFLHFVFENHNTVI